MLKQSFSKLIGKNKEQQAAHWLKKHHYQIIEQNVTCKGGEIDIVALEEKTNTLVFVEVKYRKSDDYGHPLETITAQQQQRIIKCAQLYLCKHPEFQTQPIRFDVLAFLDQSDAHHIENAFGAF